MTDLQAVQKAAKSWWRWLLYCWRNAEVVTLIAAEAEQVPYLKDKIHTLELDLLHAKEQIHDLDRENNQQKDALAHVGRFIAASHRISRTGQPGTIKELLQNAQRTN